ncbi:MAG: glycoside hydrolase family 15 protein [Candidatus Limnocylindria bacterium]
MRPSVGDYALLSDSQSAAMINRTGSIEWWSVPRFDSPSVFSRLLDPRAGHFSIQPDVPFTATRRYLPNSLVLETTFATDAGRVLLIDALALQPGARSHDIGLESPHALVRLVDGVEGTVPMRLELVPRFEYGLTVPHFRRREGRVVAVAGADELHLWSDVRIEIEDGQAQAGFEVDAGTRHAFVLQHLPAYGPRPDELPAAAELLDETIAGWASWAADHDTYEGLDRELVRHSSLVLQGLTYQPSGGVIAAATTSLPEIIGGAANWDYRFVWLRDLSLTMRALWVAACPSEVGRHLELIWRALGNERDAPVQIMVGVNGERDLSEHELDHLAGFLDSRPVRVGNEAWRQRQFDVLGEVIDAAHLMRNELGDLSSEIRSLIRGFADRAARDWREPDAGMWEARDRERHYTSSKVMRWVALDRAIDLEDRLGDGLDLEGWRGARAELREDILRNAWHADANAFTGAYGSDHLDASVLFLPMVGFIDAREPRMRATIEAIQRELTEGAHVHRWADDPNGFIICGYWLAQCLHLLGDRDGARRQFEALADLRNDVGLLAEMADPATGELIGNIPQAFSHVGLVNTAWRLTQEVG